MAFTRTAPTQSSISGTDWEKYLNTPQDVGGGYKMQITPTNGGYSASFYDSSGNFLGNTPANLQNYSQQDPLSFANAIYGARGGQFQNVNDKNQSFLGGLTKGATGWLTNVGEKFALPAAALYAGTAGLGSLAGTAGATGAAGTAGADTIPFTGANSFTGAATADTIPFTGANSFGGASGVAGSVGGGLSNVANAANTAKSFDIAPYLIGGSTLASGLLSSQAATDAAKASQQASNAATAEQARQFNITQQNQAPFLKGGTNAFNQYLGNLGVGQDANVPSFDYGAKMPQFNFDPSQIANDPAYKFAYDQAMQATQRQANASGYGNSGNLFTALQDRASGLASQQYQNAFNNAMQKYNIAMGQYNTQYGQYQDYLNRLAAAGGIGQTAANQMGALGANYAGNVGNIQMQNAANQTNATNQLYGGLNQAIQGGVGNYLGYKQNQQLLNSLQPQSQNSFIW